MIELIYEQPLNEKIRSYLRLEYLREQLLDNLNHDHQHRCFYPLFSLCELTERCDYRSDVIKDIDRQLQQLRIEPSASNGDRLIKQQIDSLTIARDILNQPGRLGSHIKQDRFLSALKQRFGMPGACCNFDLPQLHFWLAKPFEERQQAYQEWMKPFTPLLDTVSQLLQITRSTADFHPQVAPAGFYQGNSEHALTLIRVQLTAEQGCYPTISGHKNRYAIHFVDFEQQKHTDKDITFQLSACR